MFPFSLGAKQMPEDFFFKWCKPFDAYVSEANNVAFCCSAISERISAASPHQALKHTFIDLKSSLP